MPRPSSDSLYKAIIELTPGIPWSHLYTRHDLASEVYLKARSSDVKANQTEILKKLVREASYSRYRPKYKSHRTSNLTAEELLLYCSDLVINQPTQDPYEQFEQEQPTLWDYLRAALKSNNELGPQSYPGTFESSN